jgi:hypothetical protein
MGAGEKWHFIKYFKRRSSRNAVAAADDDGEHFSALLSRFPFLSLLLPLLQPRERKRERISFQTIVPGRI